MTKVIYRMETYGDGDWHVAVCPELGISRTGKTPRDAKAEVQEAVTAHLGHCEYQGILDDVLGDAGFDKSGDTWRLAPRSVEEQVATVGTWGTETTEDCQSDKGSYTYTSKSGISIEATLLTESDVQQRLSDLETKYGMTSLEFIVKYRTGEFKDHNPDFFDWECYYRAAGDLRMAK